MTVPKWAPRVVHVGNTGTPTQPTQSPEQRTMKNEDRKPLPQAPQDRRRPATCRRPGHRQGGL
nr:MAG TPA: hypothetical protein [Caudoviricetes sp.]